MSFWGRVRAELGEVDADLRRTPPYIFVVISCLALVLAATITFGGLHL